MRKIYIITILSFIAIICLQIICIQQLYTNYVSSIMSEADRATKEALADELHLRNHPSMPYKSLRNYYIQSFNNMTSKERDSLMKICPPDKQANVINLDSIRRKHIGMSGEDLLEQVIQDHLLSEGQSLSLESLYKIFSPQLKNHFNFHFLLLDKSKTVIDSIGIHDLPYVHRTALYPIGTKGLQYLQVEISIPFSDFIIHQIGIMTASIILVLISLSGLAFQLIVIKRKNEDLRKRAQTVNGRIHDLKTPLNSTVMVLNQLGQIVKDERIKKTIRINAGIVRRMICHIEEILQTVRKSSTQLILNKSLIDIPEMVENIREELDILYKKKPHTIIIQNELPADLQLHADRLYLENVFCNLIENSLKYSDDGVRVFIHLLLNGNNLKVSVEDNGWGISPKYQRLVFEDFFRIKRQGKKEVQGYGIGLGRVRSIILAHNGTINLSSAKEGGTIFIFQIPLV